LTQITADLNRRNAKNAEININRRRSQTTTDGMVQKTRYQQVVPKSLLRDQWGVSLGDKTSALVFFPQRDAPGSFEPNNQALITNPVDPVNPVKDSLSPFASPLGQAQGYAAASPNGILYDFAAFLPLAYFAFGSLTSNPIFLRGLSFVSISCFMASNTT
jgi:hypothetical protein